MTPSVARALGGLWCLLLAATAFYPFNFGWRGPSKVRSSLERAADGSVSFDGPSILRTTGPPLWVDDVLQAGAFTLTLEARTSRAGQRGPARLITLSDGPWERNFMIGQQGVDLLVRTRRPGASSNGTPPIKVDDIFMEPRWLEIQVHFEKERILVLVDGERRMRVKCESPPLELWDPGFRLSLGDEVDGIRGWSGTIRRAELEVAGVTHNLLNSPDLESPEEFWLVPEPVRGLLGLGESWWFLTACLHLMAFLPLGAFLLWGSAGARGLAGIALSAALFGATVQLGKLAFDGRHPSLLHAIPNAAGAAIGAAWARKRSARS